MLGEEHLKDLLATLTNVSVMIGGLTSSRLSDQGYRFEVTRRFLFEFFKQGLLLTRMP